jgi:hypothetical protein
MTMFNLFDIRDDDKIQLVLLELTDFKFNVNYYDTYIIICI